MEYGHLLEKYMKDFNITVWLINTGWTGGSFGVGHRFPLKTTRHIIRMIQEGKLDQVKTIPDEIFALPIPESVPGVDPTELFPQKAWKNLEKYQEVAKDLKAKFDQNLAKFS